MLKKIALIVALIPALGLLQPKDSLAETSPKADMQQTIDQIIKIATALPGDEKKTERRAKLRELINPKFNFAEMSKRSLGSNWNDLSPQEQADFTTVFSELLALGKKYNFWPILAAILWRSFEPRTQIKSKDNKSRFKLKFNPSRTTQKDQTLSHLD